MANLTTAETVDAMLNELSPFYKAMNDSKHKLDDKVVDRLNEYLTIINETAEQIRSDQRSRLPVESLDCEFRNKFTHLIVYVLKFGALTEETLKTRK